MYDIVAIGCQFQADRQSHTEIIFFRYIDKKQQQPAMDCKISITSHMVLKEGLLDENVLPAFLIVVLSVDRKQWISHLSLDLLILIFFSFFQCAFCVFLSSRFTSEKIAMLVFFSY